MDEDNDPNTDTDARALARAREAQAKAISKTLDVVEKAGPWLSEVFGPVVEDSVGLVADQIKYFRTSRFLDHIDKTRSKLRARQLTKMRPLAPKFALPLIEAATLETDPTLQELWATLMANALDPNFEHKVETSFISVLRDFGPLEALILMTLYEAEKLRQAGGMPSDDLQPRNYWFRRRMGDMRPIPTPMGQDFLGIEPPEWIAWENLERLGCVTGVHETSARAGGRLTSFGAALALASMAEPGDKPVNI